MAGCSRKALEGSPSVDEGVTLCHNQNAWPVAGTAHRHAVCPGLSQCILCSEMSQDWPAESAPDVPFSHLPICNSKCLPLEDAAGFPTAFPPVTHAEE